MLKFLLFLLPLFVYGGDDLYLTGKKLYFSKGCNGCHGVSATGNAQYPSLAYRRKTFLTYRLQQLRSKQGNTQLATMMIPFAIPLSDKQIDAITTFLSEYHEKSSKKYEPEDSNTGDGSS